MGDPQQTGPTRSGAAGDLHLHVERLRPTTVVHAAQRRDVGVVATTRDEHVLGPDGRPFVGSTAVHPPVHASSHAWLSPATVSPIDALASGER